MSILNRPGWYNQINEMADAKPFNLGAKQKQVTQGTAYRVVRLLLADLLKSKGLVPREARTVTAAEVNNIIASMDDAAVTQELLTDWEDFAAQQLGRNATPATEQEVEVVKQEIADAAAGDSPAAPAAPAAGGFEPGGHKSSFIQQMKGTINTVDSFMSATQFPQGFRHMAPSGMGGDVDHQYMKQLGNDKAVRVLSRTPLRNKADLRNSQIVVQDGSEEYNITFDQNGNAVQQSVLYSKPEDEEATSRHCGCPSDEDCEHMYTRYSSDVMPESHKLSLKQQTLLAEQKRIERYQHLMRIERRYM